MTDYTWDSGGDGTSWEDNDNWDVGGSYPDDNGDKAIISIDNSGNNITTSGNLTVGEITISTFDEEIILSGDFTIDDAGSENGNLTIGSGTFDINGNRLESSGLISGAGNLDADGMIICNDIDTSSLTVANANLCDLIIQNDVNKISEIDEGWNNVLINGGNKVTTNGSLGNVFVGAGELETNNNITANNLTIPTGGTLDGQSNTVNVSGDWKSSGGLIGKSALDLDGSSQYVTLDSMITNANNEAWTIDTWLYHASSGIPTYMYFMGQGVADEGLQVRTLTNPKIVIRDDGGNIVELVSESEYSGYGDKWTHHAYVYDGTDTLSVFLDGKLISQTTITTEFDVNQIGNAYSTQDYTFDGKIPRVSIWDTALTQSQIRELMFYDYNEMDNSVNFTTANCVGWWQMDEGQGITVADKTTNANHGTASNSGVWAAGGTFTENKSKVRHTGTGEIDLNHRDLSFYDLETNPNTTINTESDAILWIKNNATNLNEAKIKTGKGHIHIGKENPPDDYSIPQTIPIPLKK